MLKRDNAVTRYGRFTYIEYSRFADDLVILVDGFRKWEWLLKLHTNGLWKSLRSRGCKSRRCSALQAF